MVTVMTVKLNLQQNLNTEIVNNNKSWYKNRLQNNFCDLFLTIKMWKTFLTQFFFWQSQYFDKVRFVTKKKLVTKKRKKLDQQFLVAKTNCDKKNCKDKTNCLTNKKWRRKKLWQNILWPYNFGEEKKFVTKKCDFFF